MARIMREYNDNASKTLIKDVSKSSSFFEKYSDSGNKVGIIIIKVSRCKMTLNVIMYIE